MNTGQAHPATVAVVGCGGIGARHVEALGRLPFAATVYAIDPATRATERARQLFEETAAHSRSPAKLVLGASSDRLPDPIDVAIVATRAHVRLAAVDQLLSGRSVRHLVLEKFLFARRRDFESAAARLAGMTESVWVNCPRRLYPGYRALRERCRGAGVLRLEVLGGARISPIGTIGIHFADLLDFISDAKPGEPRVTLESARLVPGNRGLRDFAGTFHLEWGPNISLRLDAIEDCDSPPAVSIGAPGFRCLIEEHEQRMTVASKAGGWRSESSDFPVPLQSMLTHGVVMELLDRGSCGLTPYAPSAALHLSLLDALIGALRELEGDPLLEELPFT